MVSERADRLPPCAGVTMTALERYLAYAESHRLGVCAMAAALMALIAWGDWLLPNISVGFFYLVPVLLVAPALSRPIIAILALLCAYLREAFDPLQAVLAGIPSPVPVVLNPAQWAPGAWERMVVATAGFGMTGLFVSELNRRRRLLASHLEEREEQMRLRLEAERQVRILIETSPLAILTLNRLGRVQLANASAAQLLGFEGSELQGEAVESYLPILVRLLNSHRSGGGIRTNVEAKGVRRNGEVFLAHVWLSTYRTAEGPGLAAVIWDASENLRDREGAGLDSMMATSRVLIGAMSHEIRNLAAAAAAAYAALPAPAGGADGEQHHALGTLIRGLERIASSGLHVASHREAAVADLGTVLDEARIVIEPGLREAGISTVWEIPADLPLVQGDQHSLMQVFINLARNSRRALESAGRREIRISAGLESDVVVVRFRDTGPGVQHAEELFKPFQPGAYSAGLGLYISRAILRAHGGELRYEKEASGSCFAVELWPVEDAPEG
jgi:two-component system, LuxR family, sensor kinase FixL